MACRREIQENFIMQQATNENKLFVVSVPIDEKVCFNFRTFLIMTFSQIYIFFLILYTFKLKKKKKFMA